MCVFDLLDRGITLVILFAMKTAISIPNPIFHAAERMAHMLGISRSQLFTQAMSEYISAHKYQNITEQLNALYKENDTTLDRTLATLQAKSIPHEKW